LYFPGGAGPHPGTPRGRQEDCPPPRYATVPGLRKGNASRCNIKRASPRECPPPQPLSGARARPTPSYATAQNKHKRNLKQSVMQTWQYRFTTIPLKDLPYQVSCS